MKKFLAVISVLLFSLHTFACSTFLLSKDGKHFFGRNYDWVSGNGIVVVNSRGVQKTSFVSEGEKPVSWISKCGSITFNQFGKEFPHGGMNEKGLVVELMWLDETVYPKEDSRGAMNELQWIQYQLDNCSSVEEVIASQKQIRISRKNAVPLHFLVADALGNAATIEFINGEMMVHQDKTLPYPVLTNTPYSKAIKEAHANNMNVSGDNSVERFAKACRMLAQYHKDEIKQDPIDYSFSVLENVAQGDFTKWRIVYDLSNRTIHFVTAGKKKNMSLSEFDFSCKREPLFIDINSKLEGNVSASFAPLNFEHNKFVLQTSADESRSHVNVSAESIKRSADYFRKVACAE
jgi:penicillin V acylase-like amidase (Ntn superfamily)